MSRENLPWVGLALLLLAGGWVVSQSMLLRLPAGQGTEETFREWLWGTRSMDLAVQVGIIFVGALGIAALLPRGDEIPHGGGMSRDKRPLDSEDPLGEDTPGKGEAP